MTVPKVLDQGLLVVTLEKISIPQACPTSAYRTWLANATARLDRDNILSPRVMERENMGAQAYAYVAKSCRGQMATGTALGYQDVDYVQHPRVVKR